MIRHRVGNVLTSSCKIICHGVNCQGAMNSGIAKQIRAMYPEVYETYRRFVDKFDDKKDLLGRIQPIMTQDGNRLIINAFTQLEYGRGKRQVSYDAIDSCMKGLNNLLKVDDTSFVVGMPLIGAGLGGGDWKIIESIIASNFSDLTAEIYTLESN